MEMEGSIREFSVPEILQFLSLHVADGVLRLEVGREKVSFGFKKGKITDASHRGEDLFSSISEYIQRTGLISEEEILKYRKKAKESGLSIPQILLKEDKFDEKDFQEIISFKIHEIVDEVLVWKEGKYSFEAGRSLYPNSTFSVELEPNALVMMGIRRIDEWPQIKEVLPDDNITLTSQKKPEIDVEIGEDERIILEKFTDHITVGELVRKSGLGKFRTYNSIYKLIEIGFLEKTGKKNEEKELEMGERFIQLPRISIISILKKALLIGFILFNFFFFFHAKLKNLTPFFRSIKNMVQRVDNLD
ncbi:MAG: DUF4388 domain-containing protein [candidate division WOR-3 bacterium]|nr:DUF4388 domain-containing protein [candidate division WOR-3 bacterium]